MELAQASGAENNPELLIDDHSYFYLGYAVTNEAELEAFAITYEDAVSSGLTFDQNLEVSPGAGSGGGDVIYRMSERVERLIFTNPTAAGRARSEMPVMIERPENHIPEGGNVLYLDGHVEFIKYPSKWPMTEQSISILESLVAM